MREPPNPNWLYHTDIGTGPESPAITLTIRDIEEVECGGKTRVGLRFHYRQRTAGGGIAGRSKLLVLNATNLETMAEQFGHDTDKWKGQKVELYTVPDSGHGFGPGIRVRLVGVEAV